MQSAVLSLPMFIRIHKFSLRSATAIVILVTSSCCKPYLSKVFFFPVLANFFPPNQAFVYSVARSLRSQKPPINCISTVYKSLISYSFLFLVPCKGNLKYVFVGFFCKARRRRKILRVLHT